MHLIYLCLFTSGKPSTQPEMGNNPDIFSLIGTLFLWIYWFVLPLTPHLPSPSLPLLVTSLISSVLSIYPTCYLYSLSSFLSNHILFYSTLSGILYGRPSFVAGAAVADSEQQQRAIVNTILSLSASTIAAFWMSSFLSSNKRFRPVDIQNATLAGNTQNNTIAYSSIQ